MEDWERDDFVPPKPVVNNDRWEGEDEDDDVKDNWDDDDDEKKEEEEEEQQQIIAVQPKKKKPLAQVIAEKEKKKQQELEEKMKQMEEEQAEDLSPEEAIADKLRMQKLQEEADLELAKETFGVDESSIKVDDMVLKSKEDFDEFRKALVSRISTYDGSPFYLLFIEELCRDLALPLQADDIKKITVSLNAISTEKVKAQKIAKGKKKAKTKASLNLEKNAISIIDYGDEYEDYI